MFLQISFLLVNSDFFKFLFNFSVFFQLFSLSYLIRIHSIFILSFLLFIYFIIIFILPNMF